MVNLHGRCFLTLKDFTPEEIGYLLDLAADLKAKKKKGIYGHSLENKNIALIFEKPSTRTRCAFTVGAQDEGGRAEYLGVEDIQLGKKESVEDTARVLGRMFDGIEFRGFLHENVEKLAKYSGVPVWNGLTDDFHPTQILADFLTMREKFGTIAGKNFVFLGDGRNNMANSFLVGCGKMGVNLTIIAPKELWPEESLVELARGYAKEAGSTITITEDVDAVQGIDDHDHGGCGRGAGRRRHLHGCLGIHGRGSQSCRADQTAHPVSGQRSPYGEDGQGEHDLHALPACGQGK